MQKVNIILVEWNGYPLTRKKVLGENEIECGLGPLLEGLNRVDAGLDFDLHLVVNCSSEKLFYKLSPLRRHYRESRETYKLLQEKYGFIKSLTFRGNEGMDIGAYNQGFDSIKSSCSGEHLLFMNSSVLAPKKTNWLAGYQSLFCSHENVGLCGISMNSHNTNLTPPTFMPHIQSFFLYTDFNVFQQVYPNGFPTGYGTVDKLDLIENGEIAISTMAIDAGFSLITMAFPDFEYKKGQPWTIPEGDLRYEAKYSYLANQS